MVNFTILKSGENGLRSTVPLAVGAGVAVVAGGKTWDVLVGPCVWIRGGVWLYEVGYVGDWTREDELSGNLPCGCKGGVGRCGPGCFD